MDRHLARYKVRREDDGWTAFDIFTGQPAVVNDVPLVGMDIEEADDIVDQLNGAYARRMVDEEP
ncbi:hypothetical protein KHC28_00060 [Ancylobacter sonchi]|nr:hypothetical protein [Ancylobacter sonchi]